MYFVLRLHDPPQIFWTYFIWVHLQLNEPHKYVFSMGNRGAMSRVFGMFGFSIWYVIFSHHYVNGSGSNFGARKSHGSFRTYESAWALPGWMPANVEFPGNSSAAMPASSQRTWSHGQLEAIASLELEAAAPLLAMVRQNRLWTNDMKEAISQALHNKVTESLGAGKLISSRMPMQDYSWFPVYLTQKDWDRILQADTTANVGLKCNVVCRGCGS